MLMKIVEKRFFFLSSHPEHLTVVPLHQQLLLIPEVTFKDAPAFVPAGPVCMQTFMWTIFLSQLSCVLHFAYR